MTVHHGAYMFNSRRLTICNGQQHVSHPANYSPTLTILHWYLLYKGFIVSFFGTLLPHSEGDVRVEIRKQGDKHGYVGLGIRNKIKIYIDESILINANHSYKS